MVNFVNSTYILENQKSQVCATCTHLRTSFQKKPKVFIHFENSALIFRFLGQISHLIIPGPSVGPAARDKPRQYCWDTCNVVMLIAAPSPPYNVESPQFRYPLLQSPNIVGGEGGRIGWQGIVQALCQSEHYFIMLKLCSVWSKQQANFPHLSQRVLAKIVFKITLRKSKNICFLL